PRSVVIPPRKRNPNSGNAGVCTESIVAAVVLVQVHTTADGPAYPVEDTGNHSRMGGRYGADFDLEETLDRRTIQSRTGKPGTGKSQAFQRRFAIGFKELCHVTGGKEQGQVGLTIAIRVAAGAAGAGSRELWKYVRTGKGYRAKIKCHLASLRIDRLKG